MKGLLLILTLLSTHLWAANIKKVVSDEDSSYVIYDQQNFISKVDHDNKNKISEIKFDFKIRDIADTEEKLYIAGEFEVLSYKKSNGKMDSLVDFKAISIENGGLGINQIFFSEGKLILTNLRKRQHSAEYYYVLDLNNNMKVVHKGPFGIDYRHNGKLSFNEKTKTFSSTDVGISPQDLQIYEMDENYKKKRALESPYHGDYFLGSRAFPVNYEKGYIITSSGNIFDANTLVYVKASPMGHVNKVIVNDSETYLFDGKNRIIKLNKKLDFKNEYLLNQEYNDVTMLESGDIVGLKMVADSLVVEDLKLVSNDSDKDSVNACESELNLNDLENKHLSVKTDKKNNLILFDKLNQCLFKWDRKKKRVVLSIQLDNGAHRIAFDKKKNIAYITYLDHSIRKIKLKSKISKIKEEVFVVNSNKVNNMEVVGKFLLVMDSSGAWNSHKTFSLRTGELISIKDWNHSSPALAWDAENRKVFYYSMWSPRDLDWERIDKKGKLHKGGESPYHASAGFYGFISLSPENTHIVLGTGHIFNSNTLKRVGILDTPSMFSAGQWLDSDEIVTVRSEENTNEFIVSSWGLDLKKQRETIVKGRFLSLRNDKKNKLVLSFYNDVKGKIEQKSISKKKRSHLIR